MTLPRKRKSSESIGCVPGSGGSVTITSSSSMPSFGIFQGSGPLCRRVKKLLIAKHVSLRLVRLLQYLAKRLNILWIFEIKPVVSAWVFLVKLKNSHQWVEEAVVHAELFDASLNHSGI
eukprot:CAMPEP_0114176860 /NCGR_PEP_ID=MMETSP0043_2-20121206/37714_1 /TAXON_ID=464988 /ORGANISM="Hemiselmis andersenii, Strain CCMP644" /LENGTH=118 /DNA_ID=CAMNT_0001275191 /DNA_START=142 /DNA_END=498 /DNA_ORIENTATION=+